MVKAITVAPSADGWMVKSEAFDNEMFFRSGASAETAARDLGTKIAGAGAAVEIQVLLRDGTVGGRFVCVSADRLSAGGPPDHVR